MTTKRVRQLIEFLWPFGFGIIIGGFSAVFGWPWWVNPIATAAVFVVAGMLDGIVRNETEGGR